MDILSVWAWHRVAVLSLFHLMGQSENGNFSVNKAGGHFT
jgi:hypothetical protein